jgi:hypothetical protein
LELRLNVDELGQALRERDRAEEAQARLVQELRDTLTSAKDLSTLLPLCSACQLNIVIPAHPAAIRTVTDGVAQAFPNRSGVVGHEFGIELALQEALANATRHGCQGDRTIFIQFSSISVSARWQVFASIFAHLGVVARSFGGCHDMTPTAEPSGRGRLQDALAIRMELSQSDGEGHPHLTHRRFVVGRLRRGDDRNQETDRPTVGPIREPHVSFPCDSHAYTTNATRSPGLNSSRSRCHIPLSIYVELAASQDAKVVHYAVNLIPFALRSRKPERIGLP